MPCRSRSSLSHRGDAVLEFDGVSKRFGQVAALDGCSFPAKPGRSTLAAIPGTR